MSDNIVELKSGVTEQQVADLQQYLAKTSSDRQTVTTNNDGDATFDDLASGLCLKLMHQMPFRR